MMTPTNINSIASTKLIASIEEVDINKAIAAITDVEDYKAIIKALATAEEALVKDPAEVDFVMEPDINKRSTISVIRQDAS